MRLELFKIGPFTIYSYGLMIAIGVIAAFILGMHRARKRGLAMYRHKRRYPSRFRPRRR